MRTAFWVFESGTFFLLCMVLVGRFFDGFGGRNRSLDGEMTIEESDVYHQLFKVKIVVLTFQLSSVVSGFA
jgi:hypothetical protein